MRTTPLLIIVVLLFVVCAAVDYNMLALDENYLQHLQSDTDSTWTAGINQVFVGKTLGQVKSMLSPVFNNNKQQELFQYHIPKNILPANYTPDDEFAQCTIGIINQGQCGSSWAFPVVHSSSNRYCISQAKKHQQVKVLVFSTQYLLSCDKQEFCCNGGYLSEPFDFIESTGLPSEKCVSYSSDKGECPACPTKCNDGSELVLYKIMKPNTTRVFADAESAMLDIYTHGYVAAGLDFYNDMMYYTGGVYQKKKDAQLYGSHGIRINGWGTTQAGIPYWILANTFGTSWGMNGYMWIIRGKNECNIEKMMTAADAE